MKLKRYQDWSVATPPTFQTILCFKTLFWTNRPPCTPLDIKKALYKAFLTSLNTSWAMQKWPHKHCKLSSNEHPLCSSTLLCICNQLNLLSAWKHFTTTNSSTWIASGRLHSPMHPTIPWRNLKTCQLPSKWLNLLQQGGRFFRPSGPWKHRSHHRNAIYWHCQPSNVPVSTLPFIKLAPPPLKHTRNTPLGRFFDPLVIRESLCIYILHLKEPNW
jgi:hypothetical protein